MQFLQRTFKPKEPEKHFIRQSPICLQSVAQVGYTMISECTRSSLSLSAYWQRLDCLWTNGCVTESKTLGNGRPWMWSKIKNVAFCCQATRLYLRASSLTISVLLTFNILTFIRGNGKWMSAVHRREEEAGEGGMRWTLSSSSDKLNIETPTAQHSTAQHQIVYTSKLVKVTANTEPVSTEQTAKAT